MTIQHHETTTSVSQDHGNRAMDQLNKTVVIDDGRSGWNKFLARWAIVISVLGCGL